MTLKWLVLTVVVKALIKLAPLSNTAKDFNLGTYLDEAKEFASAGATKGMLFSSPILLALQTLNESTQACHAGEDAFNIAILVVAVGVVLFGLSRVPTSLLRGTIAPWVWFFVLIGLEFCFQLFLLARIATRLCT
jgi:hypothetical protein